MKKYYFLLFAVLLLIKVNGQIIDFKDSNFKSKLLEADVTNNIAKDLNGNFCKIDSNNDNEIQILEAENISSLVFNLTAISELTEVNNFVNLTNLDCSSNQILFLDLSGLKKLTSLYCAGNILETLNISQLTNLEVLNCSQNNLLTLNITGLNKLNFLDFSFCRLTEIDLTGLISLEVLNSFENYSLKNLDLKGLLELKELNCRNCQIRELKNISDCKKLTKLYCENNILENLNIQGCSSLEILRSRFNSFSSLNISGLTKLTYLEAGSERFNSIELEGTSNVEHLDVDYSAITSLDLSNFIKIKYVTCAHNDLLVNIFSKNGMEEEINFYRNPSLKYICADESQYTQIKNYIHDYQYENINYNSYCTFEPGGVFYTIKGESTLDSNSNSCDINDAKFSNLNLEIANGVQKGNVISNISGDFNIPVGEGTHVITPILENPNYFSVSPESVSITFPTEVSPFAQNFCVTPNGSHQDLEVTILPIDPARPGFDATYKLVFKNKGNQVKSGNITLDFNDAVLDYVSSVPAITSQIANKLVWNYLDLQPFETREIAFILNVNSPMETPAVNIDDRLSFNALITPVTDDEKPVDNSFALRQKVVGSYDPNDKTCLEGDIVTPSLIGEYVHYLIRFENTGTYPAENIVVKDMIDLSKFDISTLVPTKASHPYVAKISDGNKVEFIFGKINLPFDDANNDGYVAFKIKTLPTLAVGDSFENEANIYFDYNFPILTNKATSTFKTLGTQDFEFSKYVSIYPIPADSVLNIRSKNNIEIQSIGIYDVLGQIVLAIPNAEKIESIDVSKLKTGNYFLKIISDKGISSIKFIKL